MAGGISIHAVDIAHGIPAARLRVALYRIEADRRHVLIDNALTDAAGMISAPNLQEGQFEAVFYIADYLAELGYSGEVFQEVIIFPFGLSEPQRHTHLPLKFTPFGFSLFVTH